MNRQSISAALIALAVSLHSTAFAQLDADVFARRSAISYPEIPRKVLAFYYAWYGNPAVEGGSGRAAHWEGIDEAAKSIATSTNYPALGPYDSHDPQLIAQHCTWARQAGVDGFIVSWWGCGTFEDRALPRILDACATAGLDATIYYEAVPDPKNLSTAVDDLVEILQRHAGHTAWLRVDKKPVLFVYSRAVQQIGLQGWLQVIAEVERRYPPGAVFIGDQLSRGAARVFDGIHTYNPEAVLRGPELADVQASVAAAFPAWVQLAEAKNRISTLTLIPGYDDTKIRRPGLAIPRRDGHLYRAQWEAALQALPDWVLITSWNEWHEGSEIEPSHEYGTRYLELTAEYAARFKQAPARPRRAESASASVSEADRHALRELYRNVGVAVLPDADIGTLGTLVDLGIVPRLLSWDDVASLDAEAARSWPLLIYAAAESYRRTARTPGDVDERLLRYLRGGGTLVALPSAPMPFHYDERGKDVAHSGKFGLSISVGGASGGWEQPPANTNLRFVLHKPFPHVQTPLLFPTHGDRRWRPFLNPSVDGVRVAPLIELRDEAGGSHGLAAAYVEHTAGPLKNARGAYVWFRLLEEPRAEGLLYDLFRFLGETVANRRP